MRKLVFPLFLAPLLSVAACGGAGDDRAAGNAGRADASRPSAAQSNQQANSAAASNQADLGVVSSHGAPAAPQQPGGASAPAAGGSDRDLVKTAELDKRVRDAAARAKAPGATPADRKAATDAYLARGNVYFNAGQPRLYKYALADFKQAVTFDPGNEEAREKIRTIEDIYRQLGRPIPEVPEYQ